LTARRVPSAEGRPVAATANARLAAAIVVAILVVDQATKVWAVEDLSDGPVSIIGTDVEFHLSRNSGGAFSLFRGFTPLLALLAIVFAFILVRAVRRAEDRLSVVALALVLGGALGNLCDRVFRDPSFLSGHVVDFIKLWNFPTFNVADSCITIGAVLLVVAMFVPRRAPVT
jgi:signal peptidase II